MAESLSKQSHWSPAPPGESVVSYGLDFRLLKKSEAVTLYVMCILNLLSCVLWVWLQACGLHVPVTWVSWLGVFWNMVVLTSHL